MNHLVTRIERIFDTFVQGSDSKPTRRALICHGGGREESLSCGTALRIDCCRNATHVIPISPSDSDPTRNFQYPSSTSPFHHKQQVQYAGSKLHGWEKAWCQALHICFKCSRISCIARNAALARSKDATGRIQKGYFGRQRMDALTRGLQTNQSSVRKDRAQLRSHSIDFAHAQRDLPQDSDTSPSQSILITPQSKSNESHLLSSGSKSCRSSDSRNSIKSSRVLLALDTTERKSLQLIDEFFLR